MLQVQKKYSNFPILYLNNFLDDFIDSMFQENTRCYDSGNYGVMYPSYPVCNDGLLKDGTFFSEIAVTGFKKENIKIEIEGQQIFIKVDGDKEDDDRKYSHRGLSKRSFKFGYKISDQLDIDKIRTTLENGLLTIEIPLKESFIPKKRTIEL
jgi:HSP20 family molecular chaperone IbpA